ncbi:hypothetical protein GCM10023149_08490 [Mucilaginibacter gynuensis]|uniref:IPT/TIG domain-containing protein n=1 Tax=Mucilaginibacter gynuensis TaxID=1302236 RepID=A0ABP8FXX7_9SPHI
MMLTETILKNKANSRVYDHGAMPVMIIALLLSLLVLFGGCKKEETKEVPTVTISGINKTRFNIGDTIVVSGSNFSSNPSENLVSIGTAALKVISATQAQITAVIPEGVSNGQLSVAYAGGKATVYPDILQIIVTGQPVITSVTPSNVTPGDTVLIKGQNFTTPYKLNGVAPAGGLLRVLNVTDTTIRAIITNANATGSLVITTNGLVSMPYPMTVNKPSPLQDGRLHWIVRYADYSSVSGIKLYRGLDQGREPYAIEAPFNFEPREISQPGDGTSQPGTLSDYGSNYAFVKTNIVSDSEGNAYYLRRDQYNYEIVTYSLTKLTLKPSVTKTIIWQDTLLTSEIGFKPFEDPIYGTINIPNHLTLRLGIDGNQIYIKLGIGNRFMTGNVATAKTANSFKPSYVNYPIAEDASYGLDFAKNYVFYGKPYNNGYSNGPNMISELHYMPRGGGAVGTIPLPPGLTIVEYLTDPSHDDNILIYTINKDYANPEKAIYKFNAATGVLVKLYGKQNWIDALSDNTNEDYNQGFVWAGKHIYYANKSLPYNGFGATGIYVLNDDGSSKNAPNVYGRIDIGATNSTYNSYIPLFIDKTQAKP